MSAPAPWLERIADYLSLMRVDKPIGIMLLLWPTLWALWLAADGPPDLYILLVFVFGVVLMRSAGCVINDIADRDIDPHIRRTRLRPIGAGRVSVREAVILCLVLSLLAFLLVLTLNRLTILLSFVALGLAAIYPFMKRYTHLPQIFLGAAFGWSVPMAYAAVSGEVPRSAWLLFLATVLWATAYDTMYAMVDREDDLRVGVKSTAILFAEADCLIIAVIQGLLLLDLVIIGGQENLATAYYVALAGAAVLAVYQQRLIRGRQPEACFRAFLNNNWFGGMVFFGIALGL